MKSIFQFVLAGCLLAAVAGLSLRAEDGTKTAEKLVEELRSDDFETRQSAAAKLAKLGEAARSALERAAADDDADVRSSASKILAKLSRATLHLQVISSDGKPVGNAEGTIALGSFDSPDQGWQQRELPLKLDANGNADLKLASLGSIRFQIKLTGFLEENENNWFSLTAHNGVNPILATLNRGGSLSGTVLDAGGQPVKEATISLITGATFDPNLLEMQLIYYKQIMAGGPFVNNGNVALNGAEKPAAVDAQGKWELPNVVEGVYSIVAQAPGHYPALGGFVRVREGAATLVSGIVLKKRDAGRIELKFSKADGKPRAKESVSIFLTPIYPAASKLRIPANQLTTPLHSDQKETDEEGLVAIEDVSPGKYQLTASGEPEADAANAIYMQTEVEVKSGETIKPVTTTTAKPKKGSVKGRIMNANGKGVKEIQVHLTTESELIALQNGDEARVQATPVIADADCVTDNKGVYHFENVTPGKYALVFGVRADYQNEPDGYVFGIVVEPETQTVAPEAVLRANARSPNQDISGRIILPDGAPATNQVIQYFNGGQSQTVTSTNDGKFTITLPGRRVLTADAKDFLIIRRSGFRALCVMGPFEKERDYKLEAQEFGALRVTVVDEKDRPLAGVILAPVNETKVSMTGQPIARSAVCNAKGVARIAGLASGQRELGAVLNGYFMAPHGGDVDVPANVEKNVKFTMHPGVRVSGRVIIPAGLLAESVTAIMDDQYNEAIGANREFTFSGVTPGEHTVIAAASGFVTKSLATFTLPNDPAAIPAAIPKNLQVELVRPGGVAFDCGKEFAGFTAQLEPADPSRDLQQIPSPLNTSNGAVDGTGRAEFWNVAPGKYWVSLTENDALVPSVSPSALNVHLRAGPFDIGPLATRTDVAALAAVKADLQRGTASVTGRIQIDESQLKFFISSAFAVSLKLRGDHAAGEGDLKDAIDAFKRSATPPSMAGAPPELFKAHTPAAFEINALPAGDYTIYATFNSAALDEDDLDKKEAGVKRIATFSVKAGEKLDLGALKYEPLEPNSKRKPADETRNLMFPEDKPQEFEP